jgi:hypothetical protein
MFSISHKTLVSVTMIILASLLNSVLSCTPARADVGVRPILPGGSNIQPEADTPIQMVMELVTISVSQASEADNSIIQLNPEAYGMQYQSVWYSYIAEVDADFTMRNPTTQTVNLDAWFPLASTLHSLSWELNPDEVVPRIASFQVAVDDTSLDYTTSELPNPNGADKPALPWASFPVSFPAGVDTHIQVSYLLPLTTAVKGTELALYYVFQTGAGWAGPIGQAQLVVNLPYPASPATLARVRSDHFSIPYSMPSSEASMPYGAIFEGNQARWIWTDFEPTAQDDFSAWLIDPASYQQIQTYLAAVEQNPDDGITWLRLANAYRLVATTGYDQPSIFSASYLSEGEAAYRKAAELLPDYPAPHTGLALLALSPYLKGSDAPPEIMQQVLDEVNIAKQLETLHPELIREGEGTISSDMVDFALELYNYGVTATAQAVASPTVSTQQAQSTATRFAPTATPTPHPTLTPTLQPSPSSQPLSPTPTAVGVAESESVLAGNQLEVILPVAALVIVLLVALFLGRKGLQRK